MISDIEIARKSNKLKIDEIALKMGLAIDDIEMYGKYKAKISNEVLKRVSSNKDGKLILVTAVNPTPAGEGKTTMSIGLGDALVRIGKKTLMALREPSLGPVFGMKGGATGGGMAQVVPMEDINLHFTGDFHAIENANNLMCAALDNHLFQGNELDIDPENIFIKRAVDMNDRVLRNIRIGIGSKNGVERDDSYCITVACEVMAIFCLASGLFDLKERLGNIIVAKSKSGKLIYARDLKVEGAMCALLKDAIKPNLVQTLENNPVIVHGGPFANIAHGCNSIIATNLALKMADYVVTEAGFGSDLGAEKFLNIKSRVAKLNPSCIVLVATIRALKYNGGVIKENLGIENLEALEKGFVNLERHIENLRKFNTPVVVTLNKFYQDTEEEIKYVKDRLEKAGVKFELSDAFAQGSKGSENLARLVVDTIEEDEKENPERKLIFTYDEKESIKNKIEKVAKNIYGAGSVEYSDKCLESIKQLEEEKLDKMPICIAKTPMSFSDDKLVLGAPKDYTFHVQDVEISNGAGFIVVYAGNILTMPGLGKTPAYMKIDVNEDGEIVGLF